VLRVRAGQLELALQVGENNVEVEIADRQGEPCACAASASRVQNAFATGAELTASRARGCGVTFVIAAAPAFRPRDHSGAYSPSRGLAPHAAGPRAKKSVARYTANDMAEMAATLECIEKNEYY